MTEQQNYDVAIVGSGVSGAYTAYRLMRSWQDSPKLRALVESRGGDSLRVGVFDTLDRVGGRLWSYSFPEAPDLIAELGGQGFTALMRNVHGLATKELDLDVVPSPSFNHGLFMYLRGSRFWPDAYRDTSNFPSSASTHLNFPIRYFVEEEEKKNPGELVLERMFDAIPEMAEPVQELMTLLKGRSGDRIQKALPLMARLWTVLRTAKVKSNVRATPPETWEIGFWNWMLETVSNEAYLLNLGSAFTISFDRNYNLYDTILGYLAVMLAYFDDVPFWTIANGYDQIPQQMMHRVQSMGGDLTQNTQLTAVHQAADGFRLEFTSLDGGAPYQIDAAITVLALPKGALARLDRESVMYQNPEFPDLLNAVNATPATKFFTLYNDAWWKQTFPQGQPAFGYSTTDMPMKACYYIGESDENGRALMLASLTDSANAQFWNRFGFAQDLDQYTSAFVAGKAGRLSAPADMEAEVTAQLQVMHFDPGTGTVPTPIASCFQNWANFPYEGGWHLWHPHLQSWEIMPRIRQPVEGMDLYICGEAYSALQGWVEGGINTAEKMLQDHFGLNRAAWIDADYDIGP
ncbi:MAG: FAD-dependent oxidoreductase [Pseudomonadota bacterium]